METKHGFRGQRLLAYLTIVLFLWGQASVPMVSHAAVAEPIGAASPVVDSTNLTTAPIPTGAGANAAETTAIAHVNANLVGVVNSVNTWLTANAGVWDYSTLNSIMRQFEYHSGSHFATGLDETLSGTYGINRIPSEVLGTFYDNNGQALNVDAVTKKISIGGVEWQMESINLQGQQVYRTPDASRNLAILATPDVEQGSGVPLSLNLYNYNAGGFIPFPNTSNNNFVAAAGGNVAMALGVLGNVIASPGLLQSYTVTPGIANAVLGSWAGQALSTDINIQGYTGIRRSDYFYNGPPSTSAIFLPSAIRTVSDDLVSNYNTLAAAGNPLAQLEIFLNADDDDEATNGLWRSAHTSGPNGAWRLNINDYNDVNLSDFDDPGNAVELTASNIDAFGFTQWSFDYFFTRMQAVLGGAAAAWASTKADKTTGVVDSVDAITWKPWAAMPVYDEEEGVSVDGNLFYAFKSADPSKTPLRTNVGVVLNGINEDGTNRIIRIVDGNDGSETTYTEATQSDALAALSLKIFNEELVEDPVFGNPDQGGFADPNNSDPFFGFDSGFSEGPAPGENSDYGPVDDGDYSGPNQGEGEFGFEGYDPGASGYAVFTFGDTGSGAAFAGFQSFGDHGDFGAEGGPQGDFMAFQFGRPGDDAGGATGYGHDMGGPMDAMMESFMADVAESMFTDMSSMMDGMSGNVGTGEAMNFNFDMAMPNFGPMDTHAGGPPGSNFLAPQGAGDAMPGMSPGLFGRDAGALPGMQFQGRIGGRGIMGTVTGQPTESDGLNIDVTATPTTEEDVEAVGEQIDGDAEPATVEGAQAPAADAEGGASQAGQGAAPTTEAEDNGASADETDDAGGEQAD